MKRDIEITLNVVERNMEEVEHLQYPEPGANGVLKALLAMLAEIYLTPEQQQRVEAIIKRHSACVYRYQRNTSP